VVASSDRASRGAARAKPVCWTSTPIGHARALCGLACDDGLPARTMRATPPGAPSRLRIDEPRLRSGRRDVMHRSAAERARPGPQWSGRTASPTSPIAWILVTDQCARAHRSGPMCSVTASVPLSGCRPVPWRHRPGHAGRFAGESCLPGTDTTDGSEEPPLDARCLPHRRGTTCQIRR